MRARFQIDVQRRAAGLLCSLLDRQNLGMVNAIVGVTPGANDVVMCVYQNGPDAWIGRSQTDSLSCQFERLAKKAFVSLGKSSQEVIVVDRSARYCLRGEKNPYDSSSGSATAAPLRPLGQRTTGTSLSAYGSPGGCVFRRRRRKRSFNACSKLPEIFLLLISKSLACTAATLRRKANPQSPWDRRATGLLLSPPRPRNAPATPTRARWPPRLRPWPCRRA